MHISEECGIIKILRQGFVFAKLKILRNKKASTVLVLAFRFLSLHLSRFLHMFFQQFTIVCIFEPVREINRHRLRRILLHHRRLDLISIAY